MGAVPESAGRNFEIYVNGKKLSGVDKLEVVSQFMRFVYGWRPEVGDGYEGVVIYPPGGGGSVVLFVCWDVAEEPVFLLLLENRKNMGGPRWCAPGSGRFKKEGSHCILIRTVVLEKFGLDGNFVNKVEKLPGPHSNLDRQFVVVDPEASGDGVHHYRVEVSGEMLEAVGDGTWRFKDGLLPKGMNKNIVMDAKFFTFEGFVEKCGDVTATVSVVKELYRGVKSGDLTLLWNRK